MRKTKSYKLEMVLQKQIVKGDYALLDFPAERKLAAAFNVTQMTARKAIKNLEKNGLLRRQANGSVTAVRPQGGTVAFLAPTFFSSHISTLQKTLFAIAAEFDWQLRTVLYMHWDDAVIEESLERFDGVFLYPVREEMPERLTNLLERTKTPVVALGMNLSNINVPSFLNNPANATELIIDFLKDQGYRKIDFLLTQPRGTGNNHLVDSWQNHLKHHGLTGECFEYPVESYGDSYAQAHQCVSELIEKKALNSNCLLGATMAEAIGASRALASYGIMPGRNISVGAILKSHGGVGDYFIPSITAVEPADHGEALRQYLEWMTKPRSEWPGPMSWQGKSGHVFAGESVIPAAQLKSTESQQ